MTASLFSLPFITTVESRKDVPAETSSTKNNSKVFNAPHCSPNISILFLEKGQRGRCHPRKKTHWCLGQNKTPRLVSPGLLQVLACLKNGVVFIAWWALGTSPELTLEPLKAPQYKSACVPQVVVGISENRAQSPRNPAGSSQLRRCGRWFGRAGGSCFISCRQ